MKLRTLVTAFIFTTGLAVMPTLALAADASIQINPTAKLEARGAYVMASFQVTCPAGWTLGSFFPAQIFLQQATSRTTMASGQGFLPVQSCTGNTQTVTAAVSATAPGSPFRVGPAEATAAGSACDANFNCVQLGSGPVTIRIVH